MAWLDALLAFAVTMMVLSTLVSVIVEAGHSLLNERSKGLERQVEHMFDQVIAPRLAGQLPADMTGSRFVKQITDMRWVPIEPHAGKFKKAFYRFFNKLRRTDKAQELTTLQFLERLAESPVGAAVLDRSSKIDDDHRALGLFLEDLASKYEDFGASASVYFARRARMFSVLIGFILVFWINFNAIDVAGTLMQSEAARTALIEQGDAISKQLQEQLAREAQARREVISASGGDAGLDPFDAEALQQSVEQGVLTLQEAQLPVGWEHAPWLKARSGGGTRNASADSAWTLFRAWVGESPGAFLKWFLSVFAAGLLVGLGGPFWFDTFRKLGSLSGVARVFESEVKQDTGSKAEGPAGEKRADRFVRIFNTAREASNFARAAGRQPLTDDGHVVPLGHVR